MWAFLGSSPEVTSNGKYLIISLYLRDRRQGPKTDCLLIWCKDKAKAVSFETPDTVNTNMGGEGAGGKGVGRGGKLCNLLSYAISHAKGNVAGGPTLPQPKGNAFFGGT